MSNLAYLDECVMRKRRSELLAVLVLWLASAGASAEVYKWIDSQGKVHYGDRRPAEGTRADTLELRPAPTRDAELAERAFMRQRLLDAFEAEREEEAQSEAQVRAAKRELEMRCARLESQLTRFERASIVYTEDERGERKYMSDGERREALADARDWIAEHCDR